MFSRRGKQDVTKYSGKSQHLASLSTCSLTEKSNAVAMPRYGRFCIEGLAAWRPASRDARFWRFMKPSKRGIVQ